MSAVTFEVDPIFGDVVDRLDPVTDFAEVPEPLVLVAAVGEDEHRVEVGDNPLELGAGEALSPTIVSLPQSSQRS